MLKDKILEADKTGSKAKNKMPALKPDNAGILDLVFWFVERNVTGKSCQEKSGVRTHRQGTVSGDRV
jgi:hypothetical protein